MRLTQKGQSYQVQKSWGKVWLVDCVCDCGKEVSIRKDEFEAKRVLSCGCLRGEKASLCDRKAKNLDLSLIKQLYDEGKTCREIGKELNSSPSTISKILRKKFNIVKTSYRREKNKTWTGYGEISGSFWSEINYGAIHRNLEFNITIEEVWELFLKQDRKCMLTDLDLVLGKKGIRTASLDRIDSTRGYVSDNIQWVHKDVNFLKQDFSQDYFITLCKLIAKKSG